MRTARRLSLVLVSIAFECIELVTLVLSSRSLLSTFDVHEKTCSQFGGRGSGVGAHDRFHLERQTPRKMLAEQLWGRLVL
jgi:hypothetical protein